VNQRFLFCRECQKVHEAGLPCAEAVAKGERERKERIDRRGYDFPDKFPGMETDTNWPRLGTIEQGYNNDQPLESRADFERDRKAKGHEIVTLRELKNPRRRNPEREMEQKVHALAEKYQRA